MMASINNILTVTVNGVNTDAPAPEPKILYTWLVGGQSLSTGSTNIGYTGPNPIYTDTINGGWLFNDIKPDENVETPYELSQVQTPVVYQPDSKQTMGYGGLRRLVDIKSGDAWLYAPHGKGGRTIAQLSGVPLDNGKLLASKIPSMRAQLSKTVTKTVFSWVHIESLIISNTNGLLADQAIEGYITDLRAYQDSLAESVQSATGQSPLPIFVDMSGSPFSFVRNEAFHRYVKRYSDAYLVCPKYLLNRQFSTLEDPTHLDPEGYTIQGEYHALGIQRWIDTGESKCLQVVGFDVVGTTIELDINVPAPPMVIDTTILPAAPNHGFKVTGGFLGPELPIQGVTIDGSKIIVDVGYTIAPSMTVTAGRTLNDGAVGVPLRYDYKHSSA